MITYSKVLWGLHLIPRVYGSALPRALPFAAASAGLTAVLYVFRDRIFNTLNITQPFGFQIFIYVAAFAVIFRSNFGYQRYWEGRTHVQIMTSRWFTAAVNALHLDQDGKDDVDAIAAAIRFQTNLIHFFSLLHGLALQNLRNDWDLDNLKRHGMHFKLPPVDARAFAKVLLRTKSGRMEDTGVGRFSLVDVFMLRDTNIRRQGYHRLMPVPVIMGVSPIEKESLGKGCMSTGSSQFETIITGLDSHEPDDLHSSCFWNICYNTTTGRASDGADRRAEIAYGWLQQLLCSRLREGGGMGSVTPIVAAGVWQPLSEGFKAYDRCRQLCDTPFPFPWAQTILLTLVFVSLMAPIIMALVIRDLWLAVLLDFLSVNLLWVLNEVARDLEDPFVYEPNDLPLARFQYDFNERLLAAAYSKQPPRLEEVLRCRDSCMPKNSEQFEPLYNGIMTPSRRSIDGPETFSCNGIVDPSRRSIDGLEACPSS